MKDLYRQMWVTMGGQWQKIYLRRLGEFIDANSAPIARMITRTCWPHLQETGRFEEIWQQNTIVVAELGRMMQKED